MQHTVDIIIPVYKPDEKLMRLITKLESQTYPVTKIIIMNTEEKYWEKLFYGTGFIEKFKNIEVHHISKIEFDHGATRNKAISYSKSDIFVCMTQDAEPYDDYLIEKLVTALCDNSDVVVAYARQLPNENCRDIEKIIRSFNYPEESKIKGKNDIDKLGIKTFFCSNVCAAYHRNEFDYMGGFENRTIFNEDMIFAGHVVINKDKKIAYAADAKVIHSHNYTNKQQLHRNFDLGVSQAMHPEVFKVASSESEGVSMVKEVTIQLVKRGKWYMVPYFYINCFFKYLGYQLGLHYAALNYDIILRCTDNKNFWDKKK